MTNVVIDFSGHTSSSDKIMDLSVPYCGPCCALFERLVSSNATHTKSFYRKVLRTHKAAVEILSQARVFSTGSNSNQPRQPTLVRNLSVTQSFRMSRITGKIGIMLKTLVMSLSSRWSIARRTCGGVAIYKLVVKASLKLQDQYCGTGVRIILCVLDFMSPWYNSLDGTGRH
jgi:hypothetical protein